MLRICLLCLLICSCKWKVKGKTFHCFSTLKLLLNSSILILKTCQVLQRQHQHLLHIWCWGLSGRIKNPQKGLRCGVADLLPFSVGFISTLFEEHTNQQMPKKDLHILNYCFIWPQKGNLHSTGHTTMFYPGKEELTVKLLVITFFKGQRILTSSPTNLVSIINSTKKVVPIRSVHSISQIPTLIIISTKEKKNQKCVSKRREKTIIQF